MLRRNFIKALVSAPFVAALALLSKGAKEDGDADFRAALSLDSVDARLYHTEFLAQFERSNNAENA